MIRKLLIIMIIICIVYLLLNQPNPPTEGFQNTSLGADDLSAIKNLGTIASGLIKGGYTVPGALNISGDTAITGKSTVSGPSTLNGDITITGNSSLTGNSVVKGNSTLNGNLTLSGNSTLIGDSNQTGNSTITGKFDVIGNIRGKQLCIGNTCIDEIHLLMLAGKKTLGFDLDKSDVNGQNANGQGSYLGACGSAPCAGGATVTSTTDINRKTKFFMTPM